MSDAPDLHPVTVTGGNPSQLLLVIAPDRAAFDAWCTANGIGPVAPNARHVHDPHQMARHDRRGTYNGAAYVVAGWPEGRKGEDLRAVISHRETAIGLKAARLVQGSADGPHA